MELATTFVNQVTAGTVIQATLLIIVILELAVLIWLSTRSK